MDLAERSRRRRTAAARVLGVSEEQLDGTFVAVPVDRRGRVLVGGALGAAPGGVGLLGALLGIGSPSAQAYTVAVSPTEVCLLLNGLRGPKAVVLRVPRDGVGPVRGPMEGVVTIGASDYSVALASVDEARRLLGRAP